MSHSCFFSISPKFKIEHESIRVHTLFFHLDYGHPYFHLCFLYSVSLNAWHLGVSNLENPWVKNHQWCPLMNFLSTWLWFGTHSHGIFFAETPMFDAEKILVSCFVESPGRNQQGGWQVGSRRKAMWESPWLWGTAGLSGVGTGGNIMKWSPQNAYPMFFLCFLTIILIPMIE